jgi:spore germination protein GerM
MRRIAMLVSLILLSATIATPTQKKTSIKVYYTNSKLNPGMADCGKVYAVTRTIPATASVATAALEQLFSGPSASEKAKGYISTFSDSTKSILISVKVKNGTAYVNLKDFRQIIPNTSASCASELFLAEMDTTLKQFPSIKKAIYAIEGVPADFYGHLQMDCEEDPTLCDETPFKSN